LRYEKEVGHTICVPDFLFGFVIKNILNLELQLNLIFV